MLGRCSNVVLLVWGVPAHRPQSYLRHICEILKQRGCWTLGRGRRGSSSKLSDSSFLFSWTYDSCHVLLTASIPYFADLFLCLSDLDLYQTTQTMRVTTAEWLLFQTVFKVLSSLSFRAWCLFISWFLLFMVTFDVFWLCGCRCSCIF